MSVEIRSGPVPEGHLRCMYCSECFLVKDIVFCMTYTSCRPCKDRIMALPNPYDIHSFDSTKDPLIIPRNPQKEIMSDLFQVHLLNEEGIAKARDLQKKFEDFYTEVTAGLPPSRELSLVATKLQEASFYAKRAMAMQPENNDGVS